jgi:hypothetical protein
MKKIFSLVLMAAAALAVAGCDTDAVIVPPDVAVVNPVFVPQPVGVDVVVPSGVVERTTVVTPAPVRVAPRPVSVPVRRRPY